MIANELVKELFKPHKETKPQEDHGHWVWEFELTFEQLNSLHPANYGRFGEFIWTLRGRDIVVIK